MSRSRRIKPTTSALPMCAALATTTDRQQLEENKSPTTRICARTLLNHPSTIDIRTHCMLLQQTIDKLHAMKLFGLARSLKERLERQDHQDLSKAEFVGLLIDDEWLYRENRKLAARLKQAKFKDRAAAIEAINYKTARGLRKDQLLQLAQNRC